MVFFKLFGVIISQPLALLQGVRLLSGY